jgi:signal transduction histidine kinase
MQDIPVLFISALNETLDKVMAFGVGGVDYITKPFQFEEVAARVASHLKIRRLQLALESRNHELQQSNEELRRLQTLRDNLTNMIVHDLRSPLTGVVCAVEMIAMENEQLSSDAKKTLRHARTGLNQVIALINSVLDLGKIEAGELRPHRTMCDLLALARESAATLDPLRGSRKVTVECASETLPTYIDRDLMARVIQNFLGNAFKFTEENGTIVIRLEHANGGARLSVIDDGQGIPAEYHERIFDKYCQVNSDGPRIGTGLGLTFCRLAVEAHGGKIGVTSEPGKGSTFWLELPDEPAGSARD